MATVPTATAVSATALTTLLIHSERGRADASGGLRTGRLRVVSGVIAFVMGAFRCQFSDTENARCARPFPSAFGNGLRLSRMALGLVFWEYLPDDLNRRRRRELGTRRRARYSFLPGSSRAQDGPPQPRRRGSQGSKAREARRSCSAHSLGDTAGRRPLLACDARQRCHTQSIRLLGKPGKGSHPSRDLR